MSSPLDLQPGAGTLFSVVIPTYNSASTLPLTLASLVRQSYANFEAIVVDDGSSEPTASVVAAIDDRRIRYRFQNRSGRSAARNAGASLAAGRFLAFLDSDDVVGSTWLDRLAEGLNKAPIACCGARITLPSEEGDCLREALRMPGDLGPVYHHYEGLFLAGTFAIDRALFLSLGGYDTELSYSENTDLALRLTEHCHQQGLQIAVVDEPLLQFRRHRRGKPTERSTNERLSAAIRILEKHGGRYRRHSSRVLASYHAIAGTSAARLHRFEEARRHFLGAASSAPWILRHWIRFLASSLPGVRSRIWLRVGKP